MGVHEGKISAGSYDINRWLHGGYETDVITVLYGGAGTGKTNFCLLAAVSQAKKGNTVVYVDTEGGFSIERIKQLCGEEIETVLKNILLLTPTSFTEQKEAFEQLLKHLKRGVSLIIVDGMTMLYRLDFAAARKHNQDKEEMQNVNAELVRQLRTLAEIARKQHIPVLVTNQVYLWEEESKMVGGNILQYWGKCHIELVRDDKKRTAYLRKHRSLPEGELPFHIVNEGVKRRGWI
ncbi:MAG TPA: DNA repair and recombination protein RadB [Candidatus Nanoarchaeia archaeon]|nr:DNA repair and recombination protein RadB [Candidatus Nanoarchaeia archaeon]